MPEEKKQCCATCKYYTGELFKGFLSCNAPMPIWFTSCHDVDSRIIEPTDGSDCPCYQSTNEKSN